MDRNVWVLTLIFLLHLTLSIAGEMVPGNVTVHMWEGNVTITWDPPQGNPGEYLYYVQLNNYTNSKDWFTISHCNHLKTTICNIGQLSVDSNFKVRVGVLTTENKIFWSRKRQINIRRSQLIAPTFTLSSTSYSVGVKIHRKRLLNEIFSYGVHYTAYLWPDGQENQTLKETDDDSDDDADDGEITFVSLQPLRVYCVCVKVETISTEASSTSAVHCIKLPLDMTQVVCFLLMGLLCIMAFLMLLVFFLRRPRKMPSALKLVINVWKPMIVKSDEVETVTEKGWIIINNSDTKRSFAITEEDKERRESLDSGVSIDPLQLSVSNAKTEEQTEDVQVDSGCESLKGTEVSGSVRRVTRQFFIQELHCSGENEESEDSGLGLGHHEVSASLESEDTRLLSKVVVGAGYRSQSPSSVDVLNDMDSADIDTNIAAPSAGYRSGQVTCMCSDHEYCIWCKFKNAYTDGCQTVPESQTDFRQIHDVISMSSSYMKKMVVQTVCCFNTEIPKSELELIDNNCTESSPMLLSCPVFVQNEEKQDSSVPTRTFTLDNMELTFS